MQIPWHYFPVVTYVVRNFYRLKVTSWEVIWSVLVLIRHLSTRTFVCDWGKLNLPRICKSPSLLFVTLIFRACSLAGELRYCQGSYPRGWRYSFEFITGVDDGLPWGMAGCVTVFHPWIDCRFCRNSYTPTGLTGFSIFLTVTCQGWFWQPCVPSCQQYFCSGGPKKGGAATGHQATLSSFVWKL